MSSQADWQHARVVLGVSKSGFYEWRGNQGSATSKRREELKLLITKAFEDSDGTYGYRRVHAQLRRWGVECEELSRPEALECGEPSVHEPAHIVVVHRRHFEGPPAQNLSTPCSVIRENFLLEV